MRLWRALVRRRRILAWGGALCLLLMIPSALMLPFDDRTLNGVSVWLKPLKFQLSTGLFLLTLGWFYAYVRPAFWRSVFGGLIAWLAFATGLFEVLYITLQGALGQASHFNDSDPFHSTMYTVMGIAAVLLALTAPLLAIGVARASDSGLNPAFRWSVVLGLVLTFGLGAVVGGILGSGDGHWIGGTPSDAGGLPLFGWSRDGGDLRAAHFLGIHAMQILPLFGVLVSRVSRGATGVVLVWLAALAYAALTIALATQALAGRPLFPA